MTRISRILAASTLALALGVGALPAVSLAEGGSGEAGGRIEGRVGHRLHAAVADIVSVSVNADGTGTLTMTLVEVPQHRPLDPKLDRGGDRPDIDRPEVGDTVTIGYDQSTKFILDGGQEGTAASLTAGMRVRVVGKRMADGSVMAKVVNTNLMPLELEKKLFGGVVSTIDTNANLITVLFQERDAEHPAVTVTAHYSDNTVFKTTDNDPKTTDGTALESDVIAGSTIRFDGDLTVETDDQGMTSLHISNVAKVKIVSSVNPQ